MDLHCRYAMGALLQSIYVSWFTVVKCSNRSSVAHEGNGRPVALQQVFDPGDRINVEVK